MTIAKGIFTHHYFSTNQGSFDVAKVQTGNDGVKLKTALVMNKIQNAQSRDDYHPSTRDEVEDIPLDINCALSATAYVLGAGTQGNPPDVDSALTTAFEKRVTVATTVAASPAPSTTTFKLDSDNLEAGDMGKIDVEDGNGKVVEQRYFHVVSKDGSDVLTIAPPLSSAPTAGDNVHAVVNYNLAKENTDAITCYRSDNLIGEMAVGSKFQRFVWKFTQGQPGELSVEGQCQNVIRSIHTFIDEAGGINDTVTQFDVKEQGTQAGAILCCEDELMLIDQVSGSTLTVTRGYNGTAAAAHNDATEIGPYEPDENTAGSPIRGLFGGVWLGTDFIKAEEVVVEIDEGTRFIHYFGDDGKSDTVANPENRKVSWSIVAFLDKATASKVKRLTENETMSVFVQAGKASGRGCAFYSPKAQFNVPIIPDSKGDLVKITLETRAVLGATGEDSVCFGY